MTFSMTTYVCNGKSFQRIPTILSNVRVAQMCFLLLWVMCDPLESVIQKLPSLKNHVISETQKM